MAHLVESMMYTGPKPWHGQGVELDKPGTAEQAIVAAGLDWQVMKEPVYLPAYPGSMAIGQVVKDAFAVVRQTDRSILGVVGAKYEPLQNRDAFGFFDHVVGTGEAIYHTAGSLCQGSRVWLLAKLPDTIVVSGDDIIDKYMLLTNSHDGSSAVQIKFTPIRVVCFNTLSMALRDDNRTFSVRHTATVSMKLREVADIMGIARKEFARTGELYRRLADVQVNMALLKDFLETIIPDNNEAERNSRTQNIRKRITELFEDDWRNNLPETRGTLWSAYNAVGHFVDHERGGDQNRLASAWFGSGNALKQSAFTEAVRLAA